MAKVSIRSIIRKQKQNKWKRLEYKIASFKIRREIKVWVHEFKRSWILVHVIKVLGGS